MEWMAEWTNARVVGTQELSTQLPTFPATQHPSVHPLIHPPTHPVIHPPTQSSTHPLTHPLIHPPIHPPMYPPFHPPSHPPSHPLTHSFIHPCCHWTPSCDRHWAEYQKPGRWRQSQSPTSRSFLFGGKDCVLVTFPNDLPQCLPHGRRPVYVFWIMDLSSSVMLPPL